ncbi:MAG: hypothetical protein EA339_02060 [Rhodobacteraceae bacterium]|nr:MAG: hypothetical protein EA339_02060 [Paracoccaceae bacterium]
MNQIFECEAFEGHAFRVTWGINEGDPLGPVSQLCLGDTYMLDPAASPVSLGLDVATTLRLATFSGTTRALLVAEMRVRVLGELKFMSADGDLITALLLLAGNAHLLLPLNPMRLGMAFALIAIDPGVSDLRMAQLVTGCFATGARVTMGDGEMRPVEALDVGEMVRTRDHGPQPLRWIGRATLRAHGPFAPVTFAAGSLGNLGALTLGPLQRVFLYQRQEDRLGTRAEILVQAQYLVDDRRVLQREEGFVEYHSLVFDEHQIIYVEGIPVESMLVSRATRDRLPPALAEDLAQRFPQLNQHAHFAQDIAPEHLTPDHRASILRQKEK